jgi:hypothetical protein
MTRWLIFSDNGAFIATSIDASNYDMDEVEKLVEKLQVMFPNQQWDFCCNEWAQSVIAKLEQKV